MAHIQQIEFCESIKKRFPFFFNNKFVIDIGSLDINGNNQYLFDECLYLGVDLSPGKNVDIITKGHDLNLPNETVDVVISTECFEHDQYYKSTILNIIRIIKPGGFFIFSCATTGRPEHGTRRTTPEDAPFTQKYEEWSDYYRNLEESDIRDIVDLDSIFEEYGFQIGKETCDLYFWGIKKGTFVQRLDYSFQIQKSAQILNLASRELFILNLTNTINIRDRNIFDLNETISKINLFHWEKLSTMEGEILELKKSRDNYRDKNNSLEKEIISIEEKNIEYKKIIQDKQNELDLISHGASELEIRNSNAHSEIIEKNNLIEKLTSSRSWLITKPLRLAGRILRGEMSVVMSSIQKKKQTSFDH